MGDPLSFSEKVATGFRNAVPFLPMIIMSFSFCLLLIGFFLLLRKKKNEARVLYIHSDTEASLIKVQVGDLDEVLIGDKTHNLSKEDPRYIRTFFGRVPLYIVNRDTVMAMEIGDRQIEAKYDPKVINKMIETNMVKDIVTASPRPPKLDLKMLFVGMILGIGIGISLVASGIIKLGGG